ncbi:alpha/beta fold hydrolase [Ancylobacter sp. 6x-1]|uniref:Alpha/beta fold hydrolase n=1 Tax=Ancylobacter crimeensis TaxID=2579147 RepID=A0ABT0DCI9_9HYPH|nr:alpha/beta fold hydrolase [Ancylobacter crimeensis]MCK0197682.1 alpha/beta fold hydrolase [Ancylobacter crimeensis]
MRGDVNRKPALPSLCALIATAGFLVTSLPAVAQDRPTVLLLDGLGVYMENPYVGVSSLAGSLQRQGYRTVLDSHFMNRSAGEVPAVIIGHSMGGASALTFARRMVSAGQPAPLVITIDAGPVPLACVSECINIHGPGFPDVAGARNIDAWKSGANMVAHAMLATNPVVQQIVLDATARYIARHATRPDRAAQPAAPPSISRRG